MYLKSKIHAATLLLVACLPSTQTLTVTPSPIIRKVSGPLHDEDVNPALAGDWEGAKSALRNPDCCVVSVSGLEEHMRILQTYFADQGPSDLDLRARVNVKSSASEDCLSIRHSVTPLEYDVKDVEKDYFLDDPCTDALIELARGVALLADGPLEGVCEDVFIRVVCASDYKAHDPMYHTDKSPLRGYVTLRGVGTEFMTRICSPVEYATLRGLGGGVLDQSIRQAEELEFIVMKGDEYAYEDPNIKPGSSFLNKLWKRRFACVHRSPPGAENGGSRRRVIVSLDLADGDDDREWYEAGKKREWRSGMTQRKSHLVA